MAFPIRPPATPLWVHDPSFSFWVCADRPDEAWPRHWTGTTRNVGVMARIDGACCRLLGAPLAQRLAPPVLELGATRTRYVWRDRGVEIGLGATSPLLPGDLDLLSRAVGLLDLSARSTDGREHRVEFLVEVGVDAATNDVKQACVWSRLLLPTLEALATGTAEQPVLEKAGDNLRCDWGRIVLATGAETAATLASGDWDALEAAFSKTGAVPRTDDGRQPRSWKDGKPCLAASVGHELRGEATARSVFLFAHDSGDCIEFLGRPLKPLWTSTGRAFSDMLEETWVKREELLDHCAAFDLDLERRCEAAGGRDYAALCALSYRQAIGAHQLAGDVDGTPLFISKENFSNGCAATVDVTYPSAPLFLWLAPALVEAMMHPLMVYASSPRWRFPFAPHDLGTFPLANGQVYGGGERTEENQMPVEECGNLLLLAAALVRAQGHGAFAKRWWTLLKTWADYLVSKGLDPEHQLCTDDFAGHQAHNTNLSVKAILGVAAMAPLAAAAGAGELGAPYREKARAMAAEWMAKTGTSAAAPMTFDQPGTWSQKYNLVWDRLLGLNLFPGELARREVAHYLARQGAYGLPLDNRKDYTKADWITWVAVLAEKEGDFRALIAPILKFLGETPDRVPFSDWYDTRTGKQVGFQARSVVGGVFLKALAQDWGKAAR
ncbi:MAG: DUF4965 domain-containing protein [Spirochaetes bacterium]|nr:DUF4965 domain-containing protein [Spirochaetota bacterium]